MEWLEKFEFDSYSLKKVVPFREVGHSVDLNHPDECVSPFIEKLLIHLREGHECRKGVAIKQIEVIENQSVTTFSILSPNGL